MDYDDSDSDAQTACVEDYHPTVTESVQGSPVFRFLGDIESPTTLRSNERLEIVPSDEAPSDGIGTIHSLELYNFKSYGGSVKIAPFCKFTAIIGPNGSGKSNLMDAISFVLCIRSTLLRSNNMRELIYRRGIDDHVEREAFVALTLNGGYNTVEFKRKIQSRGNIVYLLNNNVVSFKDYMEQLKAFRINTVGCTGLIFQGAINDIATRSPFELTRLFEAISGSSLYDKPYNFMNNKLQEKTYEYRDLLNRRKTLTSEIRHYKSMAMDTRKHDEVMAQYKRAQARKMAAEYMLLKLDLDSRLESLQRLAKLHAEHSARSKEALERKMELEDDRANLYYKQGVLNRQVQAKQKMLVAKKESMSSFYTTRDDLQQRLDNYDNVRIALDKDIETLNGEIAKARREKEKVLAQVTELEDRIRTSKSKLLSGSHKKEYERFLASFYNSAIASKIKTNMLKAKIDESQQDLRRYEHEIKNLEEQRHRINTANKPQADLVDAIRAKLREYTHSMDMLELSLQRLSHDQSTHCKNEQKLSVEKQELEQKLQQLNVAKLEHRRGLKRLHYTMDLKSKIPGVHGEVFSLCRVNNACYNRAISACLGHRAHVIVTENMAVTAACIRQLKSDRAQRRDFLSLEVLGHDDKRSSRNQIEEICKRARVPFVFAIDCIDFDSCKYGNLFEHLIGDTVVVATMDDAEKITNIKSVRKNIYMNIVTHKGQTINKDRTIIINAATIEGNSLVEAELAQYSRLTSRLETVTQELASASRGSRQCTEQLETAKTKMDRLKRASDLLKIKLEFATKTSDASTLQLKEVDEKILEVSKQRENAQESLKQIEKEYKDASLVFTNLQVEHFAELNSKLGVEDIHGQMEALQQEIESLHTEHSAKSASLATIERDLDHLQQRLHHIKSSRIPNLMLEHQNASIALQTLLRKNSQIYNEVSELEQQLKEEMEQLERHNTMLHQCQEQIGAQVETTSRHQINDLARQLSEQKALADKCAADLRELIDRIKVENVDLEFEQPMLRLEDASDPDVEMEMPEQQQPGKQQQQKPLADDFKIPSLLNLDGLDLPDDQEGLQLLSKDLSNDIKELQRDLATTRASQTVGTKLQSAQAESVELDKEIEQCKAALNALEDDVSRVKRERGGIFMQCFMAVKQTVGPIYAALTLNHDSQGGQAFLSLDSDNAQGQVEPFFCNIRYNTIPPLKKFLDISLQSGGEKALSSLALLLALHCFKKSPFVILDEIDANLDSTRLKALTRFLQAQAFQTIIISLKEKVFSEADSLVGVYRHQELGISKCVILNLARYRSNGETDSVSRDESQIGSMLEENGA